MNAIRMAETGWLPDLMIRGGIRRLLRQRLEKEYAGGPVARAGRRARFIARCSNGPIAVAPEAAKAQHYEVAPSFFAAALGPHMKYSSAWFDSGCETLGAAEAAMLALTCERAEIEDGQCILDLGCGWGSLSCWIAERYPNCRILAVSHSAAQRRWIEKRCAERGLANIEVRTCDVNQLALPPMAFDRVVSVEMFEHMTNLAQLFRNVATWLRPGGKLFVHVFSHCEVPYAFDTDGAADWMGRFFFTGGMMPSDDLLPQLASPLFLQTQWPVDGRHYMHTANAWLANVDARRDTALAALATTYGDADAPVWYQRWRIFFMACAELWGYADGSEWHVMHYRFARPGTG
jgi:cyclopropane-fatty-acyl-phospholipid synthase